VCKEQLPEHVLQHIVYMALQQQLQSRNSCAGAVRAEVFSSVLGSNACLQETGCASLTRSLTHQPVSSSCTDNSTDYPVWNTLSTHMSSPACVTVRQLERQLNVLLTVAMRPRNNLRTARLPLDH
jgi:hypothetical protein